MKLSDKLAVLVEEARELEAKPGYLQGVFDALEEAQRRADAAPAMPVSRIIVLVRAMLVRRVGGP